jgi:HEAT repeat protein
LGIQKTRVARDALMEYATDNKNQEFVGYAFRSLAKIGKKKAVEFLCGKEALQSREFLIQRSAAEALQEAKDPRARDALLDVMGGRRTKIQVVGACAKALALCAPKDELVVETLFHFTKNRKDTIRASVVEAIGFLATDEAVDRLKEVLFEDKNARVRAAAATGMGHTKRAETIPFLEKALEEEKAFTVRNACMMAMRVIRGS